MAAVTRVRKILPTQPSILMRLHLYRILEYIHRSSRFLIPTGILVAAALLALRFSPHGNDLSYLNRLRVLVHSELFSRIIGVLGFLAVVPWLTEWARKGILVMKVPVNRDLSPDFLRLYSDYVLELRSQISRRMPDGFSEPWDKPNPRIQISKQLLPLQATESDYDPDTLKRRFHRVRNPFGFVYADYLLDSYGQRSPLFIQGAPGSGKSTLIFELCRIVHSHLCQHKSGWVPLILFAHDFDWSLLQEAKTLREFVRRYLASCSPSDVYGRVARRLDDIYLSTSLLIIIDGLDEITDTTKYTQYASALNRLIQEEIESPQRRVPNRYVVTCRTEDNQGQIRGHLFTLMPLEFRAVLAHVRREQRERRRQRDPEGQRRAKNVEINLRRGRRLRFLQNYIENPYLFSLIQEYYRDKTFPPARELKEVFDHVLTKETERELARNLRSPEAQDTTQKCTQEAKYIKNLMAPFCFGLIAAKVAQTAASQDDEFRLFRKYLMQDSALYEPIRRYVEAFRADSEKEVLGTRLDALDLQLRYADMAHEDVLGSRAEALSRRLVAKGSAEMTQADLEDWALQHLFEDVKALAVGRKLALVEPETGRLQRFRHNRMREYFAALFMDRVGIQILDELDVDWSNAWLTEPVRIYAALTDNPAALLAAYLKKLRLLEAHDEKALFLLENASHAVAYLPNNQTDEVAKGLLELVDRLGGLAIAPFMDAMPRDRAERVAELRLGTRMRVMQNLFASEFFRHADRMVRSRPRRRAAATSWIRIHLTVLCMSASYQRTAYCSMFPIAAAGTSAGMPRHSVFWYVSDSVICFGSYYRSLIADLRSDPLSRFLPAFGYLAEKAVMLGLWAYVGFRLVTYLAPYSPVLAAFGVCIAILCFGLTALFTKWMGWFSWNDLLHVPTLSIIYLAKKLYTFWYVLVRSALSAVGDWLWRGVIALLRGIWWIGCGTLTLAMALVHAFVSPFRGTPSVTTPESPLPVPPSPGTVVMVAPPPPPRSPPSVPVYSYDTAHPETPPESQFLDNLVGFVRSVLGGIGTAMLVVAKLPWLFTLALVRLLRWVFRRLVSACASFLRGTKATVEILAIVVLFIIKLPWYLTLALVHLPRWVYQGIRAVWKPFLGIIKVIAKLLVVGVCVVAAFVVTRHGVRYLAATIVEYRASALGVKVGGLATGVRDLDRETQVLRNLSVEGLVNGQSVAAYRKLSTAANDLAKSVAEARTTHRDVVAFEDRWDTSSLAPIRTRLGQHDETLNRLAVALVELSGRLKGLDHTMDTVRMLLEWQVRCGAPTADFGVALEPTKTPTEADKKILRLDEIKGTYLNLEKRKADVANPTLRSDIARVLTQCGPFITQLESRRSSLLNDKHSLEMALAAEAQKQERERAAEAQRQEMALAAEAQKQEMALAAEAQRQERERAVEAQKRERERLQRQEAEAKEQERRKLLESIAQLLEGKGSVLLSGLRERLDRLRDAPTSLPHQVERFAHEKDRGAWFWMRGWSTISDNLDGLKSLRSNHEANMAAILDYRRALEEALAKLRGYAFDSRVQRAKLAEFIVESKRVEIDASRVADLSTKFNWSKWQKEVDVLNAAARAAWWNVVIHVVAGGIVLVLVAAVVLVRRRVSERTGLAHAEKQAEYSELIDFLETNRFGLAVNDLICMKLRLMSDLPPCILSDLDRIAAGRASRYGKLQGDIHELVKRTLEDVKNRLNRR